MDVEISTGEAVNFIPQYTLPTSEKILSRCEAIFQSVSIHECPDGALYSGIENTSSNISSQYGRQRTRVSPTIASALRLLLTT